MSTNNQGYQQQYNSVLWQNEMIQNQTAKMRDIYSTDQQKVKYISVDINGYIYWNFVFWCIYYVLCLAVLYFLFYGKDHGFTMYFKIFLLVLFVIYPMIITTIEVWVAGIVRYIGSFVFGRPYPKQTQYETPAFSFLDAMPPGLY